MDEWEDRFRNSPAFVMEALKGGKSALLRVFCKTNQDAHNIVDQFEGTLRAGPPLFPAFSPAAGTFNGLHAKSKSGTLPALSRTFL